jgi:hypothetical protein
MTYSYVDASALIKCYVDEAGSDVMLRARGEATGWLTSRLTHAECLAALNRLRRAGVLGARAADRAVAAVEEDLLRLHVVDLTEVVLRRAAGWARREPLRGADLVHAATALWLQEEGVLDDFWCADRRLGDAAASLGLTVRDPVVLSASAGR